MKSTTATDTGLEDHPIPDGRFPEFVDWILGVGIALGGMIAIVGGSALMFLIDRELLAENIEEGTIEVTVGMAELTEAEMIVVADAVILWTGIGLLLTGLGLVVFAMGYVGVRHRAHRRARVGERIGSYGAFAVLGAIATVILSFIPLSPAVGGALSGYLERGESERTISVGALAGFLPVVPLLILLLFVLGGLVSGMLEIGQVGIAVFLGASLVLSVLIVATFGASLGAVGGYVGGWVAERLAEND